VLTEGFYLRVFGEAIPEFLFEEPGRYSVRAVYLREGRRLAESNALRFEVSEPTGAEADVAAVVREQPNIMGPGGHPGILEKRRELLEKYPDSRYLKWARLQLLWVKDSELRNDLRLRPSRSAEYLALAQEAERGDWGPFEEDALALALLAAANGGDDVLHQRLRKTLLERHPKSAWARYVRRSK
jgi:hypothetical protein